MLSWSKRALVLSCRGSKLTCFEGFRLAVLKLQMHIARVAAD